MKRHAIPSTLTSAGHITGTWRPGPAEALTGPDRWREVHARFRKQHGRAASLRLTLAAWRHGVALSGPPTHQPADRNEDKR